MFMVVYLAPGDYHRFHSPASFTANYRRHLPGFLEPVDPRYLKKHRDVIKSNERVNLFGDWTHGFFSISFVGATNVGSVKIHFDDALKTNLASP
jgi:phosphatidylserine decarboxylase